MYGEDRPYWVSDQIIGMRCHTSFGNPSGGVMLNSFFWFTIYLHYFVGGGGSSRDEPNERA